MCFWSSRVFIIPRPLRCNRHADVARQKRVVRPRSVKPAREEGGQRQQRTVHILLLFWSFFRSASSILLSSSSLSCSSNIAPIFWPGKCPSARKDATSLRQTEAKHSLPDHKRLQLGLTVHHTRQSRNREKGRTPPPPHTHTHTHTHLSLIHI